MDENVLKNPDMAMLFQSFSVLVTAARLRYGQRGFDRLIQNPYWLRDLNGDFWSFAPTVAAGSNVWNDINVGAVSLRQGATAPDLVSISTTGLQGYGFNGASLTEMLDGSLELEHDWKEASNIYFHLHWMPSTAVVGNVVWQLEYALADNGGALTSSTTIEVVTAAGGVAWVQKLSTLPAISTTGYEIGTQLVFRLFRDPTHASDTYPDDAVIHGTAGIHYQIDSIGSRSVSSK